MNDGGTMAMLGDAWVQVQGWLFEAAVQPLLFTTGLYVWSEPAFDAVEFVMLGVLQILVILAVMVPLERWRPVETWPDRARVKVDLTYTLLAKLGLAPLLIFMVLTPVDQELSELMRDHGLAPLVLEDIAPALHEWPLLSFAIYFILLDLVGYWVHRAQHGLRWWWALHALHHSQRQMTCWSDDRNHLVDDLAVGFVLAVTALVIGVEPGQFVAIVTVTKLLESFSHANVRLGFGAIGRRLLVEPAFHRRHHAIADATDPSRHDVNFGVVLPWWDMLFGTARHHAHVYPTGVDDAEVDRDGAQGWVAQQVNGVRRMARALRPTRRPAAA